MISFNHETKKTIREQWCKPLLKKICETLGYKLIYLGLPSTEALDIECWKNYLQKIIAFQCRDYPKPSHPSQSKTEIEKLSLKLSDFEKRGIIKSYSLYDGWIEEVVLRGKDLNNNPFKQNEIVTVYNLDFCNSLTMPLEVSDDKGNIFHYYKLDAICKLLESQRDFGSKIVSKKFVMFLTVHSNFWKKEAKSLIKKIDDIELKKYIRTIQKSELNEREKNIRFLKLYVFHNLKNHFCARGFTPEFFPPVFYEGKRKNWLVHFTIFGTYKKNSPSANASCNQNSSVFIRQKFLTSEGGKISSISNKKINETEAEIDSEKLFGNSDTCRLWKN